MGRGMLVCLCGYGRMTKIAAKPIYGKNTFNLIFTSRTERQSFNLVCSIWDPGISKFD